MVTDEKAQPKSASQAQIQITVPRRGMLSAYLHSSIGRKMIVAITGVILILFVIGHMLGNLQIFLGPEWINSYAQHLRDLGILLWLTRAVLLIAVVLHIYFTVQLAIENKRARRAAYIEKQYVKATVTSRTMIVSGLVIFAFVLYHLAHFTWRITDPRFNRLHLDAAGRHDVFSMMVYGFQNIYVSAFYLIAMFLLLMHLEHGASSFFQSLGLNDKKLTPKFAIGARILAIILFVGFSSIPAAVLLGWVQPAQ